MTRQESSKLRCILCPWWTNGSDLTHLLSVLLLLQKLVLSSLRRCLFSQILLLFLTLSLLRAFAVAHRRPQRETLLVLSLHDWIGSEWPACGLCVVSSLLITLWKILSTSLMQRLLSFCCPWFFLLRGACAGSCQEKLFSGPFCNAASRVSVLYFLHLGFDLRSLRGWRIKSGRGQGMGVVVGRGWQPDSQRNWRRCADVCLQFSSLFSFRLSLEERAESVAGKENVGNSALGIHVCPNFWCWICFALFKMTVFDGLAARAVISCSVRVTRIPPLREAQQPQK